jgi:regulator of sirC expression with transglutaminase-like and TPR domain
MNLDDILAVLARDPDAAFDLAHVALLLARDEYPALDVEGWLGELDAMAHEARRHLKGSPEAQSAGLCRYLFHDLGFHGNIQDYYDPRNSYLNEVLERRTGLPITLSAVAMAIGTRAGLNVVGVALPGHFVAKLVWGDEEVIFDPFHGGRRLTPQQCEILVQQVTGAPFEVTPEVLEPVALGPLVVRLLTNLKGAYLRRSDFVRAVPVIERLRQILPDDILQRRDLGVCLVHTGRAGQAIDHLAAYVAAEGDASDIPVVTRFLHQARAEVARWN